MPHWLSVYRAESCIGHMSSTVSLFYIIYTGLYRGILHICTQESRKKHGRKREGSGGFGLGGPKRVAGNLGFRTFRTNSGKRGWGEVPVGAIWGAVGERVKGVNRT